ncbi:MULTISPECIES: HD-GYP domain-containing protein [Caproicibacterium]|uniref:HD domain-containing phosphohydrolase n=1 Tax=Caproicibacterium argilliputei TaxID=3030016 RepID=A0AA97H2Z9_9FIRM|nr:HD domain-containing phosphohydrolase [Caproicibacterium argilliputei]WOC32702.1 HD domain-containing phosphohydrolase [Caproicibacterium argilliputei]
MPNPLNGDSEISRWMQSLPKEQRLHSAHVKLYTAALAETLRSAKTGCPADELSRLGSAAYFHDIGKAWVPRALLLKAEKLTPAQLQEVRRHPLYAEKMFALMRQDILCGMPEPLFQTARACAVFHHEWWNGQGYPYGLSGKQIPFAARVTSLCDVYDAITSSRVYRKAHSHAFACREIETNAGVQFDPALARIFLDHAEVFRAQREALGG